MSIGFAKLVTEKKDYRYLKTLKWLTFFHFIMGIAFYFLTRNGGGDAWTYWVNAKNMSPEEFSYNITHEFGTYFIEAINYIPVHFLEMSFFANTMFYAMLGSFGVSCFYAVVLKLIPYNSKLNGRMLFPLLFFLPNMHFWSSGVGKDTIMFMSIGMFVYGMLTPFRRIPLLIISAFLTFAIRPHVVLFMAVAFGVVMLFGTKMSKSKKIFFSLIFISAGIAMLPTVMTFASIDNLSVNNITSKAENQSKLLQDGAGSGIDISSYPLPLKIFTFLFRPLFFDARSINSMLASFENAIILILAVKAFRFKVFETYKAAPIIIKALLIFLVIGSLLFSITLGNLGVMIRMRNMFLPGFVIYLLWAFSYREQLRREKNLKNKN
ncbi:hypothetical protein [Chryseobacterium caseinilyticum]|uniref:Glycosyltransferase RgtA/B/C/D-like domain-containing protein n=1 Tax=Chryseobacterium caseinilyticum TaxID=2771428 RepID=A0ABR8ZH28_9FLAO|nr:hypothetical protein [Chryseobacterium caseinilyticum]MBD8084619.1 hypothetical protein [Chryseobacterium caseinilyticum]